MKTTGTLEENLQKIKTQIDQNKVFPSPLLLAVAKKQPAEKIRDLYQLGQRDFAENYLQEALAKQKDLQDLGIHWHFIGPLQSKKIKEIVGRFHLIHTVSRKVELEKMSDVARAKQVTQNFLVQVNIANEPSKRGVAPNDLSNFLSVCQSFPKLNLRGLMFFPPLEDDEAESIKWFEKAKKLFDANGSHENFNILSMGTSGDFALALRSGSTLVRIGEALFGPRDGGEA